MIGTGASSASQSVELLDSVREEWEAPVPILEVITDHGSEFINTHQDERPCLDHKFEAYLHMSLDWDDLETLLDAFDRLFPSPQDDFDDPFVTEMSTDE